VQLTKQRQYRQYKGTQEIRPDGAKRSPPEAESVCPQSSDKPKHG